MLLEGESRAGGEDIKIANLVTRGNNAEDARCMPLMMKSTELTSLLFFMVVAFADG